MQHQHEWATSLRQSEQIWIVGGGGLGRVYFRYLQDVLGHLQTSIQVAGFLDNHVAQTPRQLLDRLGDDAAGLRVVPLDDFTPHPGQTFVCAMGRPDNKQHLVVPFAERGATFTTLVHPEARVDASVLLGGGCVVGPGSILNAGVRMEDFCSVYPFAYAGEDVHCAACCTLFTRCTILEHCHLEDASGIWTGAMLPPHTKVGANATVGMGSVVLKDVAPGTTVIGNPARTVFTRE